MDNFGEFWVLVFPLGDTIYIYTYVNTHTEGSKQNVDFDSSLYLGHSAFLEAAECLSTILAILVRTPSKLCLKYNLH